MLRKLCIGVQSTRIPTIATEGFRAVSRGPSIAPWPCMTTESVTLSYHPDEEKRATRARAAQPNSLPGMLWFAGWLFTIGFGHLVWWKALLALVLWPYFLGTMFG